MKKLAVLLTIILTFTGTGVMAMATTETSDDITELLEQYQSADDGSGLQGSGDITGLLEQYQDAIKQVVGDLDESTVNEAFSFIKEKAADGSLENAAGLEEAIEEGKEKFGVEIGEAEVEEVLGLVNQLEEMGFDSEKIIDQAETMYAEYGADFVEHTGEIVVDAVKDSLWTMIKKAVGEFFRMIGESIKNFFTELF